MNARWQTLYAHARRTCRRLGYPPPDRILLMDADRQRVAWVVHAQVRWEAPCSTSAWGLGGEEDSFRTPVGLLRVVEKIGDHAPLGMRFVERKPTGEIWRPGMHIEEDWITTRILRLQGEEWQQNRGGRRDTFRRTIYIHGTPQEDRIGRPASHGCIRLRNEDVRRLFDLLWEGDLVFVWSDRMLSAGY